MKNGCFLGFRSGVGANTTGLFKKELFWDWKGDMTLCGGRRQERKGKHLTWNERITIERMLLKKFKVAEISKAIGCCRATIYNEIKRATYEHTLDDLSTETRYNPDQADEIYRNHLKMKGNGLKIEGQTDLIQELEYLIVEEKYSPEAALMNIRNKQRNFEVEIKSVNTIYSYIDRGIFENIKLEHLPVKRKKRKKKVKRQKRASPGTSIENRPDISNREEFGHWEMDTVIGKVYNKKSLLVFTERKSRMEIIRKLDRHTTAEVVNVLDSLEKKYKKSFGTIFKSITVDNGAEFMDFQKMEKSYYSNRKRTNIYYCHPYTSCERGSNETNNKLIRRFLPKGTDFDKVLKSDIVKKIERWMNQYPRKLFHGSSALDIYKKEMEKLEPD